MLQSENVNELFAALSKAQANLRPAQFNKVNPHFKSKYADMTAVLDAVRKPLADHGLAITQTTEVKEGAFVLVTRLGHSSGQWIAGEYPLPHGGRPHEVGSAISYAKRYSLSAIVGVSADDDDDANAAQSSGQVATIPARQNPHVTQPRDVNEYEERVDPATGEILDCIPVHLHRAPKLKVADARPVAETLLHAMRACKTAAELVTWAEEHAEQFAGLPDKWISMYQGEYQALLDNLRKQKAA